ncbi:hypothetical protein [Streptomyces sp. NEAU-174]|uniref:hypothetical protein n=1 Tax=Streptomyces sp. NEAU-174 TaxID=3458254 RepID=UPI004045038B
MGVDTWVQAGMGLVGAVGGIVAARSARRTRRQERRDDFSAVTGQMEKTIQRLEKRMEDRETEAERQRERIGQQDAAIGWLLGRVRGLTGYIRQRGMEPPAPNPIPTEAREYIRNLDV